jgi:hypothetical protein
LANTPLSAVLVLKALAVVPVTRAVGFAVVELDEKAPVVCSTPMSMFADCGDASLPTVHPVADVATAWSASSSSPKLLTTEVASLYVLTAIYALKRVGTRRVVFDLPRILWEYVAPTQVIWVLAIRTESVPMFAAEYGTYTICISCERIATHATFTTTVALSMTFPEYTVFVFRDKRGVLRCGHG